MSVDIEWVPKIPFPGAAPLPGLWLYLGKKGGRLSISRALGETLDGKYIRWGLARETQKLVFEVLETNEMGGENGHRMRTDVPGWIVRKSGTSDAPLRRLEVPEQTRIFFQFQPEHGMFFEINRRKGRKVP